MNEEDENRIAVLNRDTGEVSVWELTIQKEYDIRKVYLPFRLRNGPRIVFLAFHGDMPKKKKAPEKGLSGALSLLQNFFFKRSNQCASY